MAVKWSFKLHDAVDADRESRDLIDEDIGWVHVLEGDAVGGVVHTLTVPVVAETLRECQLVDFLLRGQAFAVNVGLGQDNAEEAVSITSEANDTHHRLWEKGVVKNNGFKGFLRGREMEARSLTTEVSPLR